MGNKISVKDLVFRFRSVHGNLYDYSRVIYTKMKDKVEIICKTHGSFYQTPDHHFRGTRCPKCMLGSGGKIRKNEAAKAFVDKAVKVHGKKYNYSKVKYNGHKFKVEIICPTHGSFWQEPSNHLYGFGCKMCGRVKLEASRKLQSEEFFVRCQKTHKNKYKYVTKTYLNPNSIIKAICPSHGEFKIKARNHLWIKQGCVRCHLETKGLSARVEWKDFYSEALKVHGDTYKYKRSSYTMLSEFTKIKCAYHGWFQQRGQKHLAGQGCPVCARQSHRGKWHTSLLPTEFHRQPSSFYYLKIRLGREIFYKIGISNDIKRRIQTIRKESGYSIQVIYSFESDLITVMTIEEQLQAEFKKYIFKPKKAFAGYTECYEIDILGMDI